MAFGTGRNSITFGEISNKVTDAELISHYLGVTSIPCFINSPLRQDKRPSFGLYSKDGNKVYWTDLATGERGGTYDLLCLLWNCDLKGVLQKIHDDMSKFGNGAKVEAHVPCEIRDCHTYNANSDLQCKVREWKQHDLDYWNSYGIPLEWLRYAEVYPISHKIVVTNGKKYVFGADKLAYAYVERKEGKVTLKIYQPLNKDGHKWMNKHDKSVISLWTKVPEFGERIVICSSLKDALCLWANTNIPALAVQGEGYNMSNTAISELKRRFKHVYVLFDNDDAGLKNGRKLAEHTGFTNIVLPPFTGGKDISDLYKKVGKKHFIKEMLGLFENDTEDPFQLPF